MLAFAVARSNQSVTRAVDHVEYDVRPRPVARTSCEAARVTELTVDEMRSVTAAFSI